MDDRQRHAVQNMNEVISKRCWRCSALHDSERFA
jgi:hypothetical protein